VREGFNCESGVTMTRTFLIALVALVVLAGCGGSNSDSGDTSAPPAPVSYESVYDLKNIVENIGVECDTWSIIPTPDNAVERATCTESLVMAIHTDAAQVQRSVDSVAATLNAFGRASVHVTGPNWSINCGQDEELGQQLAGATGGDLQVSEP
jgi:hypothetical protein